MRLRIIIEAVILAIFVISALVIMFGINKVVPAGIEGDITAEEHVQRANRLYAVGKAKHNQAAVQYWNAINLNPHIAAAYLRLAGIYYENTWNYEALRALEEVKRIEPNTPGLYLLTGKVHNEMGDTDKAREAFRRATILQPENSETRYYLGTVYEQQAMKEEAVSEYEKAVEGDSDSVMVLKAHLQLGRIYKDRDRERAKSEFIAALGINPASAEVASELRILYRKEAEDYENRDEYDKAVEKYEEILAIAPDTSRNLEVYMKLGDIYRNSELYDKATTMYEAAAKLDPLNFDAFSALKELELLRDANREGITQ